MKEPLAGRLHNQQGLVQNKNGGPFSKVKNFKTATAEH